MGLIAFGSIALWDLLGAVITFWEVGEKMEREKEKWDLRE